MNSRRVHTDDKRRRVGYRGELGVVYLLHFEQPYLHCQHYLGFTARPLPFRLGEHVSGNGSGLTSAVAAQASNGLILARTWPPEAALGPVPEEDLVDQAVEMVLKCRAESPRLCPICNPDGAYSLARYFTRPPAEDGQFLYVHPKGAEYGIPIRSTAWPAQV